MLHLSLQLHRVLLIYFQLLHSLLEVVPFVPQKLDFGLELDQIFLGGDQLLCDVVVLVLFEGEFLGEGHVSFNEFDVFLCQKFHLLVEELVDPLVLG